MINRVCENVKAEPSAASDFVSLSIDKEFEQRTDAGIGIEQLLVRPNVSADHQFEFGGDFSARHTYVQQPPNTRDRINP